MPPVPPDQPRDPQETIDAPPDKRSQDRRVHKEPEQIGPFRVLERVGEGGMGIVYKAEQRDPVRASSR